MRYLFDLRMSRVNDNGTISTIKREIHWNGKMTPGGAVDELVAMVDEMNRSSRTPEPTSIVVSRADGGPKWDHAMISGRPGATSTCGD